MDKNDEGNKAPTAFLVDLVSNRKIPIATPRCRVGRDDLNDIVISGDQSISRFHFIISFENGEFSVQDAKSRHGTFLNGNQLTVSESIKDGDVLKVGVSLFWFVVEGSQLADDPAKPSRVSAITESEVAAATAAQANVAYKAGSDQLATSTSMPAIKALDQTQEMQKPDPAVMDKLEEAANSIKMDDKPEPKASLASLLADARAQEAQEPDKKKEELASLASKDRELLAKAEEDQASEEEEAGKAELATASSEKPESVETTEAPAEVQATAEAESASVESSELTEDAIPARPTNKPSDTVTLEALTHPGNAASKAEAKVLEKAVEIADAEDAPEEPARASQLTSAKAASSDDDEESPDASDSEKEEVEMVSKGANSNTKSANAGIIDSSRDIEDEFPEDRPSAKLAEKMPVGDLLRSSGGRAEAPDDIEAVVNASIDAVQTGSQPMAEATAATAEIQSGSNGAGSTKSKTDKSEESSSQSEIGKAGKVSAESQDLEVTKFIKAGASAVPDWCKRYFSDEIAKLNHELDDLNEQVRLAQQKIRDVETRVALTRGIRNTLLTTTGDELVEACGKVLSLLGWKVTISGEDKHELRLEVEDKHICIARVIWTTTKAERSHLGQLSISQTRYWMEKGVEPKGIIIVSKISGEAPTAVGDSPEEIELNDYAAKRNVCLMSTLQLLSLYKEIALSDASPDKLRGSIVNASGWLPGHNLEPGSADVAEDEAAGGKDANKLSSLLSA